MWPGCFTWCAECRRGGAPGKPAVSSRRIPGAPSCQCRRSVPVLSAQEAGVLALLLPYLAVTAVDRAVISGGLVSIWVRAAAGGAACPGCGTWCTEVRDRYWRRLRDAAAGGRRVLIWLRGAAAAVR